MSVISFVKKITEKYLKEGKRINPSKAPTELTDKNKGVFVTIKNSEKLRGCIGMIEPSGDLVEDLIDCTISACNDPRLEPVTKRELPDLSYEVNLINPIKKLKKDEKTNPEKEGLVVKADEKTGVLLPNLDGINSFEKQLRIAKRKAGIHSEDCEIYKFTTQKYHG